MYPNVIIALLSGKKLSDNDDDDNDGDNN